MLNKKKVIISIILLMIFAVTFTAAASTAKSIALGDNFSALEGVDSFYANPAGLGLRDNNWSFVADLGGGAWANFLATSGDSIDLNEALNIIESEDIAVGFDGYLGGRMYYKSFGLGLGSNINGIAYSDFERFNFILDEDDTIDLTSGEIDLIEMEINNLGAKGAAYADASLSYGFSLGEERIASLNENRNAEINSINFGVTGHYLQGVIFEVETDIEEFKMEYLDENLYYSGIDGKSLNTIYSDEIDASGYSFDLGMNMRVNDRYTFAFSMMNIGEMESDNLLRSGIEFSLTDEHSTESGLYSEIETEEIEEEEYEGSLTYTLPRTIRLGASMDYSENITFYGDYANIKYDGLDDSEHKIGVGAEARWINFLPLRMGVNYSSLAKNIEIPAGFGLNFKHYKLDFGFNDLGALWDSNKGVRFGISSRIDF